MVALITGAAGGIGEAIAVRLAKEGYDIAVNDLNSEVLSNSKTVSRCRGFSVNAESFVANVASHTECEELIKAVTEKMGSIDILVNNAGITRDGLLLRMSEEDYDKVIAVNQKSVFNMIKFAGTIMRKQKKGRIINISSVVGLYGNAGQMNYSASKAAVIGMTKTAAKELGGKNITVNAVAPGFICTPMTDKLTENQKKSMLERTVIKRFGMPEEIAGVVAFLAGDDASYITGQVIEISGGLVM